MQLTLLAKDFINTDYCDIDDCPVARASKRLFKGHISVSTYAVWVFNPHEKREYKIENSYWHRDYICDFEKASIAHSDTIIRTLNLLPI